MRIKVLFLWAILCLIASPGLLAQRGSAQGEGMVEVKLASPMPRDSAWGKTLDRMAVEWARVTNNEVRLRVLHNGQEGTEGKMLSSLSSNNIQAGIFTSFGLSKICPGVMTLSVPFIIRNDAELDLALKETKPLLEAEAAKTDFFVLAWSKVGWVNFFSKDPVFTPDDLRKQKIASSPETREMNTAFITMRFQVEEAELTNAGPKLASGAIGSVYMAPAAIAAYQLDTYLKNMMDPPIAAAMGGIVINKITWNKINRLNPAYQRELIRVTQRIASEFDASMPKTSADAVAQMSRRGLKINKLSPAQEEVWRAEMRRVIPSLLGKTFDQEIYQRISAALTRYRGGQ
ncbi:MAG: TRAP transporter substrate-binding protein DctP [Treponema sp.]|nr:TRAP transporter substrate-binding protein DctP [Treponema sp.]